MPAPVIRLSVSRLLAVPFARVCDACTRLYETTVLVGALVLCRDFHQRSDFPHIA
jgi:hypothetical protein